MHGRRPTHRVSLVLPAYNEAEGIGRAIAEADAAVASLAEDYELLVVDDGSRDGTAEVVRRLQPAYPRLRLLEHGHNRGYGAALRTGFVAARFDRVAFTDADCQFHLDDLAHLLSLSDHCPIVVGYRVGRQDPWRRRFFSWGYNRLVRALLGTRVRDCDCALKVFHRDILPRLMPQTDGFFVNTEMLTRARQLGLDLIEVGVRHRPRLQGASKVSLGDIPRTLAVLLPFWWSRVLFAGRPDPAAWASLPGSLVSLLVVVVLAAVVFFSRLTCPLQEPQEARYAEIPRQMLAEGSLLVPVLHGQAYYDKPPLLYWLVMSSYAVFGVEDWAARLVASGAAFGSVLVTWWWGRRVLGDRAGLAAAVILCLSARFVQMGRLLTMDGLLGLQVVAALAFGHAALCSGRLRWNWWLLSAAAVALALLTKGPVGLVLVLPPLLAYQWLDERVPRPGLVPWGGYLLAAVGLAAPWYAAILAHEPAFASYFFWRHHLERYLAPFDHAEPAWFYLPTVLLGMLPWTLLLFGLGRFLARRSLRAAGRRPAALGMFLLSFAWCFGFFTLSGCKRATYILPAMPLLALALGCYLDAAWPRLRRAWDPLRQQWLPLLRCPSTLAYRATLLVLLAGASGCVLAVVSGLQAPAMGLPLAVLPLASACWLWRHRHQRLARSWATCALASFLLVFVGVQQFLPSYARRFSLRGQVRPLESLCRDSRLPVVCYPRRWDSVSFYLKRNDVRTYTTQQRQQLLELLRQKPRTLVFVKSDGSHQELLQALPGWLQFVPQGRQGTVRVGLVQRRQEAPPGLCAHRASGAE
jgi:dolichol-phosphate mannosyltransferase